MPHSCCVVGCTTRQGPVSRSQGVGLFRIPVNPRRRCAWIRAISRNNWIPKPWDRVCGRHFVCGVPIDDPEDVDYRPTLLMKGQPQSRFGDPTPRSRRVKQRAVNAQLRDVAMVSDEYQSRD
jgi:THAP domain